MVYTRKFQWTVVDQHCFAVEVHIMQPRCQAYSFHVSLFADNVLKYLLSWNLLVKIFTLVNRIVSISYY